MSKRGRRIAFDYGDVRTGVALCDPDGILASPLPALKSQDKSLFSSISALIDEYLPVRIFVGLPVNMSGTEGGSAEKAKSFADALTERFRIEVVLIDERLSTGSAARNLRESGKNAKDSKASIDMAAAVSILEFALDLEKRK